MSQARSISQIEAIPLLALSELPNLEEIEGHFGLSTNSGSGEEEQKYFDLLRDCLPKYRKLRHFSLEAFDFSNQRKKAWSYSKSLFQVFMDVSGRSSIETFLGSPVPVLLRPNDFAKLEIRTPEWDYRLLAASERVALWFVLSLRKREGVISKFTDLHLKYAKSELNVTIPLSTILSSKAVDRNSISLRMTSPCLREFLDCITCLASPKIETLAVQDAYQPGFVLPIPILIHQFPQLQFLEVSTQSDLIIPSTVKCLQLNRGQLQTFNNESRGLDLDDCIIDESFLHEPLRSKPVISECENLESLEMDHVQVLKDGLIQLSRSLSSSPKLRYVHIKEMGLYSLYDDFAELICNFLIGLASHTSLEWVTISMSRTYDRWVDVIRPGNDPVSILQSIKTILENNQGLTNLSVLVPYLPWELSEMIELTSKLVFQTARLKEFYGITKETLEENKTTLLLPRYQKAIVSYLSTPSNYSDKISVEITLGQSQDSIIQKFPSLENFANLTTLRLQSDELAAECYCLATGALSKSLSKLPRLRTLYLENVTFCDQAYFPGFSQMKTLEYLYLDFATYFTSVCSRNGQFLNPNLAKALIEHPTVKFGISGLGIQPHSDKYDAILSMIETKRCVRLNLRSSSSRLFNITEKAIEYGIPEIAGLNIADLRNQILKDGRLEIVFDEHLTSFSKLAVFSGLMKDTKLRQQVTDLSLHIDVTLFDSNITSIIETCFDKKLVPSNLRCLQVGPMTPSFWENLTSLTVFQKLERLGMRVHFWNKSHPKIFQNMKKAFPAIQQISLVEAADKDQVIIARDIAKINLEEDVVFRSIICPNNETKE
eukprot:CAMPEP_0114991804 /NCGR_PEP_ID=MMETSP0216-20121206/11577_1 /TAXON_ID=223996 /ORGANISM="Protocruzia adherens, Strain Boccale" /LENGTH=827 /DNA_ID=CAMNT_0002355175 /DNA_START=705 /DNA_END=3188 /DNA_ORIENTATION=-